MSDLEQRLNRLESRFAIQDLVVNYATLLDDRQWDGLGELWAQQGVFASPNSTTVGRDAIVDNFRTKLAKYTWTLHDPHGHSVEFDDDTHARGTVIGYSELGGPDATLTTSIRYLDDYVLEDGRWRFARRSVLSLYGLTLTDLAAGGLTAEERKRWPGRPAEPAELPDFARVHAGYPG
jgi:hypothetical protein